MGIHLKHLALLVSIVASSLVMAADKNCVDCGMKDVQGMPENKSLAQLERIVKSANKEDDFRQATQDDYFDKYCEDFEEEFLEEVEQGNYMNSDEDFFEFMSYKFESSIGDYEDQKYDEYDDERHGL